MEDDTSICKIVSSAIADIIRQSLHDGFRSECYQLLAASSTKEVQERLHQICRDTISEKPSHGQATGSMGITQVSPLSCESNNEILGCSKSTHAVLVTSDLECDDKENCPLAAASSTATEELNSSKLMKALEAPHVDLNKGSRSESSSDEETQLDWDKP